MTCGNIWQFHLLHCCYLQDAVMTKKNIGNESLLISDISITNLGGTASEGEFFIAEVRDNENEVQSEPYNNFAVNPLE